MNSEDDFISINLDVLSSIENIPAEPLIFQRQYETLIQKILHIAKKNIEEKNKQDIGSRACFFIDGTRGSGKSTLMRAVRKALTEPEKDEIKNLCITSLADIDPTELAKGENFFMYILGKILDRLEQEYKRSSYRNDQNAHYYEEALECIRNMSGGLRLIIDAEDSLLKSTDPEFFIEESVEKCASSSDLRHNLNTLLDKLCNITGTKIFLVTIDDADMNFSKCASILEYVRKYMHSPRLVFLFAGDMQLYAHVVRGMQMNNFEPKLFQYDNTHQDHRLKILDRLEDQYLLKFFPVDNRVALNSFAELRTNDDKVMLLHTNQDGNIEKQELRELLKQKLSVLTEDIYISTYKNFLSKLPLRSVLSLLRLWKNSDEQGDNSPQTIADGIQRVALQALLKYQVDYTELHNCDLPTLLKTIIRHLAMPEIGRGNPDLLPQNGDTDVRFGSFYLSALVSKRMQHHSAKLAYLCSLFPNWNVIEYSLHASGSNESREHMIQQKLQDTLYHIQEYNAQLWGAHATDCMALATELSPGTSHGYGFGTIRLLKKEQLTNKEKGTVHRTSFFQFLSNIPTVPNLAQSKLTPEQQKAHCALVHSFSCVTIGKSSRYYLSIFNLIFTAVELLDIEEDEEKRKKEIKRILTKGYLPCAIRHGGSTDTDDVEHFGSEDSISSSKSKIARLLKPDVPDSLINEISDWINKFAGVSYISTAKALQLCWNDFCLRCENKTANFLPEYAKSETPPKAFKLLQEYMLAFEKALSSNLSYPDASDEKTKQLSLANCVSEFPLWSALKMAPQSTVITALDRVNIVTLKSKEYMLEYSDAKRKVDDAQRDLHKLQRTKNILQERYHERQDALLLRERVFNGANTELTQIRWSCHEKTEQLNRAKETYNTMAAKERELVEKTKQEKNNLKQLDANRAANINDYLQFKADYRVSRMRLKEYLTQKESTEAELHESNLFPKQKISMDMQFQRSLKRYTLAQEIRGLTGEADVLQNRLIGIQQSLQAVRRKAAVIRGERAETASQLKNLQEQSKGAATEKEAARVQMDTLRTEQEQSLTRLRTSEKKEREARKQYDIARATSEQSVAEIQQLNETIAEAERSLRIAQRDFEHTVSNPQDD